jgi:uncharacterized protein (DUF58 family)
MNAVPSLRMRLGEAAAGWARRRQGDDTLPLTLLARRIYILPTRFGFGCGFLLFAMLLAGLNYNNSLTLLLTFLLTGFVIMAIHECHRQLKGLVVTRAEVNDTFAGTAGRIDLRLENTLALARDSLCIQMGEHATSRFEMLPLSVSAQHLSFVAPQRGRLTLSRMKLFTTAPTGLFRTWSWVYLPLQAIVYPQPRGNLPLPGGGGAQRAASGSGAASGSEEWSALRPFVPGDSPRSVAWKLYARDAPMLVSQYEDSEGSEHILDFALLGALTLEDRLSQLTSWALSCERLGTAYALQLPRQFIAPGRGTEHRQKVLRALALFDESRA